MQTVIQIPVDIQTLPPELRKYMSGSEADFVRISYEYVNRDGIPVDENGFTEDEVKEILAASCDDEPTFGPFEGKEAIEFLQSIDSRELEI